MKELKDVFELIQNKISVLESIIKQCDSIGTSKTKSGYLDIIIDNKKIMTMSNYTWFFGNAGAHYEGQLESLKKLFEDLKKLEWKKFQIGK